jgi:hypothetical protein
MTLDEFIAKVRAEPPRTGERDVHVPHPELLADLRQRKWGMLVTNFIADPRKTKELRTFRAGHVLGPGASPAALVSWKLR